VEFFLTLSRLSVNETLNIFLWSTMKKVATAIDIGGYSVKTMLVARKRGKRALESMSNLPYELPEEASEDSSFEFGRIDNSLSLDSLHQLAETSLRSIGKMYKSGDAISALAGDNVIAKQVSFPNVSVQQISKSIQWEAKKHIPFAIDDSIVDFNVLRETETGYEILLVAAYKDDAETRTQFLERLGFESTVLDYEPLALLNCIGLNYAIQDGKNHVFLDIGYTKTIAVIYNSQQNILIRELPIAGKSFDEEISRRLEIDMATAEQIKKKGSSELTDALGQSPFELTIPAVEALLIEIKKLLTFYEDQARIKDFACIYFSGGSANSRELTNYLTDELGLKSEIVNPFKCLVTNKEIRPLPEFSVAVGLAWR